MAGSAPPMPKRRTIPSDLAVAHEIAGARPVDEIGIRERAATFTRRSIKADSQTWGLKTVITMTDLTTLEGADTEGKVRALCRKARTPDPSQPDLPSVAAVCVYPAMVAVAADELADTGIHLASVATGFPAGQVPLDIKLRDVAFAVSAGADEIDMVIDRGAFLSGDYGAVYEEIVAIKQACGDAHLKVILETGELGTYDNVRRASLLAMAAGADFIKTSTGKISEAATMPVTLVMLEAIRDYYMHTGRRVGMKPAGGISKAKLALQYLVMVNETLGAEWLTPDLFRFGASSLLNDVLMQLAHRETGAYQSDLYFTVD